MKLNKSFSHTSGFTLIETLVALAVLTVALGASVTLSRAIYAQAQTSSEVAQMNNLADESIASLRFLRDSAYAQSSTLAHALGGALGSGYFEIKSNGITWHATGNPYTVAIYRESATSLPSGCERLIQQYVKGSPPPVCKIEENQASWDIYDRHITITQVSGAKLYTLSVTLTNQATKTQISKAAVVGDVNRGVGL